MSKHKVLIVGGGFAGVKTALELRQHDDIAVTLLSDSIDFRYYPTFYHTATGGLKAQSRIPLKRILDERTRFVLGTAKSIDREARIVHTGDGRKFHYDSLVLALGNITNFFGIKGLEEYAHTIKSLEGIARFKRQLHEQLAAEHKPDLHYIIVGAGPTGIELAGALPEYLRTIMRFHGIKHRAIRVELVEAAPRLLPRSNKAVSRAVRRRLRALGVHINLNSKVEGVDDDELFVNGTSIKSRTIVWTAGVANHPFFTANRFALAERGKVAVDQYLQAEPNIYVLGDNANTPYSGLAQTALHDAVSVSANIVRITSGGKPKPYKPVLPVSVIPVGDNWAAVEWGTMHFSGKLGWLLRSAADFIGFKDLQPWWRAGEQWMTEFGQQEECPTCQVALQGSPDDILKRT